MHDCLTIIDRKTSLFTAVPLPRPNFLYTWLALQNHWISTHGLARLILTDKGAVFRSQEWADHMQKLGIEHRFTLVANPACNGKVERVHRTMKSILKSYQQSTLWPFYLAHVVLAVNTHYDHDLQSTPAYRAYGFSLLTPGLPNWVDITTDRFNINKRKPSRRKEFLSPDWNSATHAYVRILQRKHKLSPLFRGPFPILERQPRSMLLDIDGNLKRISYLHLHPILLPTNKDVTSDSRPPNNKVTSDSRPSTTEVTSELRPTNKEVTSDLRPTNEYVTSDSQPPNHKVTSDSRPSNTEATSDLPPPINEVTGDSQSFTDEVTSDSQVYIFSPIAIFSPPHPYDMTQVVEYVTTNNLFSLFSSSTSSFHYDMSTDIKMSTYAHLT